MSEIKNCVQLSKENGTDIISRCRHVIDTTKLREKVEYKEFSLLKLKWITKYYLKTPQWWAYRKSILHHLDCLELMLDRPDPIYISLLSYEHLLRLANNDWQANPVFITNY